MLREPFFPDPGREVQYLHGVGGVVRPSAPRAYRFENIGRVCVKFGHFDGTKRQWVLGAAQLSLWGLINIPFGPQTKGDRYVIFFQLFSNQWSPHVSRTF